MMPFFKYLLSAPVLTARIPQFAVYGLFYWLFPLPYMLQLGAFCGLGALATEYGRFLTADGPQDPAMTAQFFIDAHVPALVYYSLILAACGILVLCFVFPRLIPVWNVCALVGSILPSYYIGKYTGMTRGSRLF